MLASYEHDFKDCVELLNRITEDSDPISMLEKNQFALDNAQKLLKQMEVEATAFMADDNVRRRVSTHHLSLIFYFFPCQMTKHKSDFDKVRKQIRKL